MSTASQNIDILALSRSAFDDNTKAGHNTLLALKNVANNLLLNEQARQTFADSGYAAKTADLLSISGDDRQQELICSRILFLLTYKTTFSFESLFDDQRLADSIYHNLDYHAKKYQEVTLAGGQSDTAPPTDVRALSETLKLIFNLNQFYPSRAQSLHEIIGPLLVILANIRLQNEPLQQPLNYLINALLNIELVGSHRALNGNGSQPISPLFPASNPSKYTERLIEILDLAIQSHAEESLEPDLVPLLTLIRRIKDVAPEIVVKRMCQILLPSDAERDQPLGRSDTPASRLLRILTTPVAAQIREGVSSLLFELSDKDPATFVRNVGYGYAAGYLMTHKIPIPEHSVREDVGEMVTNVAGREVNPVTGQRRDMEPPDPGLNMSDEEKEREAERLFVLFERLKATGVVNVTNPVEQAAREGRLEEVDDDDDDNHDPD